MKKLFFAAIVLVLTTSAASAQNIGFIRNAQSRITANLDPIKAEWENHLASQNMSAVLTNFEITSGADKETGKTYYLLLGTNRDKTLKVVRALKLVNGNLVFLKDAEQPSGIQSCSGCATCHPIIVNGAWDCEGACPEGKVCNKLDITQPN